MSTLRDLRVITWNLWWRFGPWQERQQAILAALGDAHGDVVTVQESWVDHDRSQARELGEALGLPHLAWSPNRFPHRWRRRLGEDAATTEFGNAVLSRWPIVDTVIEPLPTGAAVDEGRSVLGVIIEHPRGLLPVLTTHLNSHPSHSAVRVKQVRTVIRTTAALLERAGDARRGPLLTGDFNAEPDSDEVRLASGLLTAPVVDGLVLVDAWRYSERGENDPGWTWRRENEHLRGGNPNARIDYILTGLRTRTLGVDLIGDRPAAIDSTPAIWPSDHAGVIADLAL